MRIVYIDFETYYNRADYSLKKLTTEQYIRDPRFEVIMLTARVDDGPMQAAWGHDDVGELIASLGLDRGDTVTAAHNARFDATILEWVYGVRVNFVVCTMLMMRETGLARVTGESLAALADFLRERGYNVPQKGHAVGLASGQHLADMSPQFRADYEAYCRTDTDILAAGVEALMPKCSLESLRVMDMTLQMYTRPVFQLDTRLLTEYLNKQTTARQEELEQLSAEYGYAEVSDFLKQLRSKPKFAELLKKLGIKPPMKESVKKSEKAGHPVYDYAFAKNDLEFQQLAEHRNPRVAAVVNARLGHNSSINESRTRMFLELSLRGSMPVPLEYARAHTGRYGGSDKINLQNLPKRGGDKTLRHAIMAPPGFELGGADSSQVEARLLAYAACQDDLVNVFAEGSDPYCYMASAIYGIPYDTLRAKAKPTKSEEAAGAKAEFAYVKMRNVGKESVLGSGYGMSGKKFAERLAEQGLYLHPTDDQIAHFRATAMCPPDELEDAVETFKEDHHYAEALGITKIYRKRNSRITSLWRTAGDVIERLLAGESGTFGGPNDDLFLFDGEHTVFGEKVPGIKLPNGYWLLYYKLHVEWEEDDTGNSRKQFVYQFRERGRFIRKRLYGGSLVENLIQALAFAVLKWQAIRIHQQLPVRMNVHDEWMSVYRGQDRAAAEALYMHWMRQVPPYIAGCPLDCEFTHGVNYGNC